MSQDGSNAPAPDGQASADRGHHAARGGLAFLTGNVPMLAGLILLLVLGAAAFVVLGGGDEGEAAGTSCIDYEVRLTTAPVLKDVVEQAVKYVEKSEACIDFTVTEGSVKDVIALLDDPNAEMPELFIPDGPT